MKMGLLCSLKEISFYSRKAQSHKMYLFLMCMNVFWVNQLWLHSFLHRHFFAEKQCITTPQLCSKRALILNWPAFSPNLPPVENIQFNLQIKNLTEDALTVEQLKFYIKQEWETISLSKPHQLSSSLLNTWKMFKEEVLPNKK